MENQQDSTLIIKKHGINIGLILGIFLGMVTVVGYAFSTVVLVSYWTFLYLFLVIIILGIVSIAFSKKELGGFISFEGAFTSYFIMLVIGMFISSLINYLIFNIVDTDFENVVNEKQIEAVNSQRDWVISKLYDAGSSDSDIEKMEQNFDEAIEKIRNTDQYGIGQQIKGLFVGISAMSIFGVLLALILKQKDPSIE